MEEIETLLQRYIEGRATAAEKEKVVRWLDEDEAHWEEYRALRKLYDLSLWTLSEVPESRRSFWLNSWPVVREVLKVAAVLLIGFWGASYYFRQPVAEPSWQTVHVPAGQRVELTLSDGTEVWLNSLSTLRFPDRFAEDVRQVELDGEGYFSVKHNEQAPFTVQTADYAVRVLGTEFNVKAYRQSRLFETALIHGSVEVNDHLRSESLRLKPNEVVRNENGHLKKEQLTDLNYFKWKEGLFCFDNETIGSLMEKLELYYDVDIRIQPESPLLAYRYSGKFRIKDGIEHVLKVLQLKHHFVYQIDEENNIIEIH